MQALTPTSKVDVLEGTTVLMSPFSQKLGDTLAVMKSIASAVKETVEAEGPSIIHVDSHIGNDANDGSAEFPLLTLQEAHKRVRPDGVVKVMGGTYEGPLVITKPDTSWEAGYQERPKIVGNIEQPLITIAAENVILAGMHIHNRQGAGVLVTGDASGSEVVDNTFIGQAAIVISPAGDDPIENLLLCDNIVKAEEG